MHCQDAAVIGHQLCLAHLQRIFFVGSMMSQKVKNQMDTLCLSFQYEGPSLITERTKPAHLWVSARSPTPPQVRYSLNGSTVWTGSLDSLVYITPFDISQHLFLGMLFYFIYRNIHKDERLNISVFTRSVRLKIRSGHRRGDLLTQARPSWTKGWSLSVVFLMIL